MRVDSVSIFSLRFLFSLAGVSSDVFTLYQRDTAGTPTTPCGRIVDGALPHLATLNVNQNTASLLRAHHDPGDVPIWLPASRRSFEEAADAIEAEAPQPWIWPTQDSPISDVPSLRTFLNARPRWMFVLDPVGMLTPAMLGQADDHLVRIFSSIGGDARAGAALLTDAIVEGDRLVRVPLGRGRLSSRLMMHLWRAHVPSDRPVGLLETQDLAAFSSEASAGA